MADIDPIEFGKLCENVNHTHTLVKEMDAKLDGHHDRISGLENHNDNVKKTIKLGGGMLAGLGGFFTWLLN